MAVWATPAALAAPKGATAAWVLPCVAVGDVVLLEVRDGVEQMLVWSLPRTWKGGTWGKRLRSAMASGVGACTWRGGGGGERKGKGAHGGEGKEGTSRGTSFSIIYSYRAETGCIAVLGLCPVVCHDTIPEGCIGRSNGNMTYDIEGFTFSVSVSRYLGRACVAVVVASSSSSSPRRAAASFALKKCRPQSAYAPHSAMATRSTTRTAKPQPRPLRL